MKKHPPLRRPSTPSKIIRIDQDLYDFIREQMQPGESMQGATSRLVREAIAREKGESSEH